MRRIIIYVFFLIILFSCNTANHFVSHKISTFKKMEWLLGQWDIRTMNYYYSENWRKENDTSFTGKSIMIVSGDTVLNDEMNIGSNKQVIFLSSKSKINYDSKKNLFKLTKVKKDRIIFENPANPEEKKVTYILSTPTMLNIHIEGNENTVESYGLHKINK